MPLFKCTSSKSTPRKAISYITDPNKAEFVSVRNLFGRSSGGNAWRVIAEGIGAVEREMQQLGIAAEYASYGLDAESERSNREQQKVREQLERERRECDAQAGENERESDRDSGEDNERRSGGYGKGD